MSLLWGGIWLDYFQLSTRKRGFITATHTSTLDDGGEMMLFSIAMKEREPLISGECKKKKKEAVLLISNWVWGGKFVSLEVLAPLKQGDTALLGEKKWI